MKPMQRWSWILPDDLRAAWITLIAICALSLGGAGFLHLRKSPPLPTAEVPTPHGWSQQGRLVVVSEEGATCQQMSFDNKTGYIIGVQKAPCAQLNTPQLDADTPLGSIRKALRGQ
jgi:hypothetical protein